LISFSTSPGAEAEDGNGADSPYTTALLSVAKEPNLQIEEALKRVRIAVYQATDGRQVPWESSSLTAPFMFVSSGTGAGQGAAAPKPPSTAAKSVGDWRKDLQGKEPRVAYDLVIADNSVAALEAFNALFAQSPYAPRARSLLERQREMLAWESAVAINTAASFEAFLASYADSDLSATARKLRERVRNRSLGANAALALPTNVALAPTCPCSTPPTLPLMKKVDMPPPAKRVDKSSPKRRPPPDEVIVERGPPGPPPGAVLEGVGIGIGLGLGGMGGRSQGMPMPRNNNYGR
jgi:Caspase domain